MVSTNEFWNEAFRQAVQPPRRIRLRNVEKALWRVLEMAISRDAQVWFPQTNSGTKLGRRQHECRVGCGDVVSTASKRLPPSRCAYKPCTPPSNNMIATTLLVFTLYTLIPRGPDSQPTTCIICRKYRARSANCKQRAGGNKVYCVVYGLCFTLNVSGCSWGGRSMFSHLVGCVTPLWDQGVLLC